MSGHAETADVVSLSIHGPLGVVDLVVPAGASSADLAAEYSRVAGLPSAPALYTALGRLVDADTTLAEAGLHSGGMLVAVPADVERPMSAAGRGGAGTVVRSLAPGRLSLLWCCLSAAAAVAAGWLAAPLPAGSGLHTVTIAVLLGAAVVSAVPAGPVANHRVQAAPAFAGAAAFAIVWDPAPERLPTILGISALVAGVAAAVCRALGSQSEEGLRLWMWGGALLFAVTVAAALVDAPAALVWAVLLVVAMLAARVVPALAVDVPDHYLLDLERVTAWSARDRPIGRRGRIIVPREAVAAVAESGARMTTAACVAIMVVVTTSAPLLLRETAVTLDHWGARALVGFGGAAVLLTARRYRHAGARGLLRVGGLAALVVDARDLIGDAGQGISLLLALGAIMLAGLLVVVAVALGRGWRSAWWSRRAEVAESVSGAFAMGAVVVASGFVRYLWELIG